MTAIGFTVNYRNEYGSDGTSWVGCVRVRVCVVGGGGFNVVHGRMDLSPPKHEEFIFLDFFFPRQSVILFKHTAVSPTPDIC